MKIFFVGSYKEAPITGGHVYHSHLVEALKKMNHKVYLISVFQMPRILRIKIFSFMYAFYLLLHYRPDLIIQVSDTALKFFPFSVFTQIIRIRTIQLVHHIEDTTLDRSVRSRLIRLITKFNVRRAYRIIVNSIHTKKCVMELAGSPMRDRISVIHPGVDSKIRLSKPRDYRRKKIWHILAIGAVIKRKGYHTLIEALHNLKKLDFLCTIVGKIEDRGYYENLIQSVHKYNLEDRVNFAGFLTTEEIRRLYEKSDIFILPSLLEGYGIVLSEALCYGLPIITTNTGAIPDMIHNRKNGLLFEPGDVHGLTRLLVELCGNTDLAQALSYNALQSCERLPMWKDMQDCLQQFLHSMMVCD